MPNDPVIEIRNRAAVAGWVFMAIWMGMLGIFTWIMARDGPHPSQPAWVQHGAIAIFWFVGIPVTAHLLAQPVTRFVLHADRSAAIHRRSVLTREVEAFPPGSLAAVECRQGKDDEGDPVWSVFIVARDGRECLVREGRLREDEEAAARRLRAGLGLLAESPPSA
jgi:hypothetical protein